MFWTVNWESIRQLSMVVLQFGILGLTANGFPIKTFGNDATSALVMPADF
jgi:hypothetical protein